MVSLNMIDGSHEPLAPYQELKGEYRQIHPLEDVRRAKGSSNKLASSWARLQQIVWLLGYVVFVPLPSLLGHGVPIHVHVDEQNKLIVTNGLADPNGYAPMIYHDGSVDSQLDHVTLPNFGPVGLINLPGFDIRGMEPGSGLTLHVEPRPVLGSSPATSRLLWHWSPETEQVQLAEGVSQLRVVSQYGQITVPQTAEPVPQGLQVAEPEASDLGQHVHFLRYLLDDSGPAPTGAYGFFGWLSSPSYARTDSVLIVFNNGLDETQLTTAALAINEAATIPSLAGDFNSDGVRNVLDADLLCSGVAGGQFSSLLDLNRDSQVNQQDMEQFLQLLNRRAGDANLDGLVNQLDYQLVADRFGLTASWSGGDFDCSGATGFSDFLRLAHNFDETASLPPNWERLVAVPEPSSALIITGVALLGSCRWRSRAYRR